MKAYELNDTVNRSNGRNRNGRYGFSDIEAVNSNDDYKKIDFDYLKNYGNVFSILDTIIDLKTFDTRSTLILNSDQPIDVSNQKKDFFQLLVNLHVLNDQIKLNDYLLQVRESLLDKGVFVGALLPHHYRYRRYLKKYSFYFANVLYFFDFLWKRVMPKLPITREIYFTFSKEKDRAISLAEGLGRLVYCGFKILDLVVVDDVVYFAAAKNGSFNPDKKFFYSPIFKMKRVGKNGKPIYVYKLRTMYPYSEFIQDFIYNQNKLETGGKFKNDFRVPAWGRLFRKLWIDELPMLINWLKGDLKIVGVRPISNHYLSLYSKDHQERRKTFKPGLLPPYYADMPKTIEEIEQSEKRYLDAYERNPLKTDFKYFIKALDNILIGKKRSA
ncbi:MAG: sugar transferase [bacterium]|nr:sugar transferase [bacterium]